jgi:hypothetical protein
VDKMEPQNLTYSQVASYDQVSVFHHHKHARRKRTRQIIQTQNMLEVAIHSTKYLQKIEFSDQVATRDNNLNYIKRNANSMEVG